MKKILFLSFSCLILTSCFKGKKVDLVVYNAKIHTLNETNTEYQAMAIKDGKIVELGPERQILNKYRSEKDYDAGGKDIYPGFTDAHTHLLLYAQQKLSVDLKEVKNTDKLIVLMEKYRSRYGAKFIIGRNYFIENQNDKTQISKLITEKFSDIPVFIITQDAHCAILNQKAIQYLSQKSPKDKGLLLAQENGFIAETDFFRLLKYFPKYNDKEIIEKLFEIQDELLQYGIVAVHEMGWSKDDYQFFKKLSQNKKWLINISAYLLSTPENLSLLKSGPFVVDNKLQICGIKIFLDGTFGSESAAMDSPYLDGTNGTLNYTEKSLDSLLLFAYKHSLQVAVHSAGDKSSEFFLERIKTLKLDINNLQWRMEHLQKVNPEVLQLMTELHLIPSIQPYHAVSDNHWLNQKLKVDNTFYAYHSLLKTNGIIAIGSDLPIETFNPYEIIYAATKRKDRDQYPQNGFNSQESITVLEAIKAYAIYNPQIVGLDGQLGKLRMNGSATFFSTDRTIDDSYENIRNYAVKTFINGKEAYSVE